MTAPMRQIDQILYSFRMGARTLDDLQLDTGLSKRHCSAYVSQLVREGKVRVAAKSPLRDGVRRRAFHYEVCG